MDSGPWYAGIEAGGSKWRVGVGRSPAVIADDTITTTNPDSTISACVEAIRGMGVPIDGAGIASFGPLDLNPTSHTYGFIKTTPKPGWSNTDVKGRIERELGIPAAIEIDVGGAALGEAWWGAGRGLDSFVYVTVGTGIGAALLRSGQTSHEHGHPEMGHISVERETEDAFAGVCPFHRSCLEGMAAGPAIRARWGVPSTELNDRAEVWDLEARYLAQGLATYAYTLVPQRIIVGGGIMQQPGLLELVRKRLAERINGYGPAPPDVESFVVPPELGQDAGLIGAIALALDRFETTTVRPP